MANRLPARGDPDDGAWGSSHGSSKSITHHAAKMMGIPGYHEVYPGHAEIAKHHSAVAKHFLSHIINNRSEEPLHHGFEDTKNIQWQPGQVLRLPLTATSGDTGTHGYGVKMPENQKGIPTMFSFPAGTPMVGYSRNSDAITKEFGYRWSEALTAGEFHINGVSSMEGNAWWRPKITVVSLAPKRIFHPEKGWMNLG